MSEWAGGVVGGVHGGGGSDLVVVVCLYLNCVGGAWLVWMTVMVLVGGGALLANQDSLSVAIWAQNLACRNSAS